MDFVVFRSQDGGLRAVQVERGKGVPKGHEWRDDDKFGVVIDDVDSPEQAIWRAALECYGGMISELVYLLESNLEEIYFDRDRTLFLERIDEVFKALKRYRAEGVRNTENLGQRLAEQWSPEESPPEPECPGQLSLLSLPSL